MDELRLVSGTTAEDPRGEAPADVLASADADADADADATTASRAQAA